MKAPRTTWEDLVVINFSDWLERKQVGSGSNELEKMGGCDWLMRNQHTKVGKTIQFGNSIG